MIVAVAVIWLERQRGAVRSLCVGSGGVCLAQLCLRVKVSGQLLELKRLVDVVVGRQQRRERERTQRRLAAARTP